MSEITEVTPLMVALFGYNVRAKGETIIVDEWLEMKINVISEEESDSNIRQEANKMAVKTIIELQKALNRFLSLAFRALDYHLQGMPLSSFHKSEWGFKSNLFFENNPIRKTLVEGIKFILQKDFEMYEAMRRQNKADLVAQESESKLEDLLIRATMRKERGECLPSTNNKEGGTSPVEEALPADAEALRDTGELNESIQ